MGKPTGFLEYKRKNNREERPEERIQHYNEFHQPLPERERRSRPAAVRTAVFPSARQVWISMEVPLAAL